MIAPVLSCTKEVGIPLTTEANNSKVAVRKEMAEAASGPIFTKSFPLDLTNLYPNMELPIPKQGAMIKVITIKTKAPLLPVFSIFNSLVTMEAIGPEAFPTLLAPIEKAT